MSERLETLKSLVAQNPADSFMRYGLAMEYANSGDPESAVAEFNALIAVNQDYAAAYYQGGHALEKLGRLDDARDFYRRGIAVTTRTGDQHTRSELQASLDFLGE
ncbi:MAG: tetratricopeptide repeat protein [Bryobacteraceae bacterium]